MSPGPNDPSTDHDMGHPERFVCGSEVGWGHVTGIKGHKARGYGFMACFLADDKWPCFICIFMPFFITY